MWLADEVWPLAVDGNRLYQHAEHYFRIMNAANEDHQHRATRPDASADVETEMADGKVSEMDGPVRASPSQLRTDFRLTPR